MSHHPGHLGHASMRTCIGYEAHMGVLVTDTLSGAAKSRHVQVGSVAELHGQGHEPVELHNVQVHEHT